MLASAEEMRSSRGERRRRRSHLLLLRKRKTLPMRREVREAPASTSRRSC
jgi:hypothetical protein